MALPCPDCNSETGTTDTRVGGDGGWAYTRRRRTCKKCNKRFTTLEVIVADGMPVGGQVLIIARDAIESMLSIVAGVVATRIGESRTVELVDKMLGKLSEDD